LGRASAAAPALPRYDGAVPTTPPSGSTRPSASVHCCSAAVVVVNAAKLPSGVAVWHPMQLDDVLCACAYCVGSRIGSTVSSPGVKPYRAALPVVPPSVVQ
jgi:hypothetical protein